MQVKWFKGDEELKPSDRFNMEVTPKHAVLTVKKADKNDEAPYRVEMENPAGKDKADLKAKVKAKDSKYDRILQNAFYNLAEREKVISPKLKHEFYVCKRVSL